MLQQQLLNLLLDRNLHTAVAHITVYQIRGTSGASIVVSGALRSRML